MNLEGILSISGKPGLYKLVSQTKNTLIVEGLTDSKRFPLYASHQVSALEDMAIYTYDDSVALSDVFSAIAKKENGGLTISHKLSKKELFDWLREVLSDFDENRVYQSDIKKLVQWYNALHAAGLVELKKQKDGNKDS